MRKILILLVFILAFSANSVLANYSKDTAKPWNPNKTITSDDFNGVEYHKIDVLKEATYEFVITDPKTSSYTIILSTYYIAWRYNMTTNVKDNDPSKTVYKVRLKKGTYYVSARNMVSAYYRIIDDMKIDAEPNQKIAEANPIPLDTMIYGRTNIHSFSYDIDYYKFTLNKPKKVTIGLGRDAFNNENGKSGTSSGSYFKAELFTGNDNTKLKINHYYAYKSSVFLPAGTYYLEVYTSLYQAFNTRYEFIVRTSDLPNTLIESESGITDLNHLKTVTGIISEGLSWRNSEFVDRYVVNHIDENPFILYTTNDQSLDITIRKWNEENNSYESSTEHYIAAGQHTWAKKMPTGKYQIELKRDHTLDDVIHPPIVDTNYTIRYDAVKFTDVSSAHPYRNDIEELANKGIFSGYPNGEFKPQQPIMRKHVLSMLNKVDSLKLDPIRPMREFKDFKKIDSYYGIIKPFYEAGIISGSGDYLNPDRNLTRAQLAVILVNAFNLELVGKPKDFKDVNEKNGFYNYIQILASHGITSGSNGNFMPNQPVTRQHFALFLKRTIEATN